MQRQLQHFCFDQRWVGLADHLVNRSARRQAGFVLLCVALGWRHESR
jgi:hypothetical protein